MVLLQRPYFNVILSTTERPGLKRCIDSVDLSIILRLCYNVLIITLFRQQYNNVVLMC